MAQTTDKLALNITILEPDKLTYALLYSMVIIFRSKTHQFPDVIEFTAPLLKAFRDNVGSERDHSDYFLGIRCVLYREPPTSHNLVQV